MKTDTTWKALKQLAVVVTFALSSINTAQTLPVYDFSHTPAPSKIMNDYTVRWDTNTEILQY